jgi:hypothetical protein
MPTPNPQVPPRRRSDAAAEQKQAAARCAWAKQAIDAFFAAQDRVGEAWTRIFRERPDLAMMRWSSSPTLPNKPRRTPSGPGSKQSATTTGGLDTSIGACSAAEPRD